MKKEINMGELSNIFEKIQDIICTYFENGNIFRPYIEDDRYSNKGVRLDERTLKLYLSNGEILRYKVSRQSLAHLLGIDTDVLLTCGAYSNMSSYEILTKIIDSPNQLKKTCDTFNIDINRVISPYINEKVEAFEKNVFINLLETMFICKYDKNRSYGFTNNSYNMNYLIVQKKEEKYYLLALAEDKNEYEVPMSNQVFDTYDDLTEKLSDIICNQELTMINGMHIMQGRNVPIKIWMNNLDREDKIRTLVDASKKLDCIPNTTNDYLYSLKLLKKNKKGDNLTSKALSEIALLMADKKVVKIEELSVYEGYLSEDIIYLIDSYNDSLINTNDSIDADITLSATLQENKNLKSRLEDVLKELEEINSNYNELQARYSECKEINEDLQNKIESAKKALS